MRLQVTYPVLVPRHAQDGFLERCPQPGSRRRQGHAHRSRRTQADQSKLQIRWSPSIAAAMVDALPYLIDYPYGCTEQTVNRFVPAVITRKVLTDAGIPLRTFARRPSTSTPNS